MAPKGGNSKNRKMIKSIHPTSKGKEDTKPSKVSEDMKSDCKTRSKALLDLEDDKTNAAPSIESKLLLCRADEFSLAKDSKCESSQSDKKPNICALPESQVLGKLKDFLGVISEANTRLYCDAKDHSEKYDIEVLTGNETEYIEMDLMLGVADLHTPEAVAAAETALAGCPPSFTFDVYCSDDENVDDDNDDYDNDNGGSADVGKTLRAPRTYSLNEESRGKIVEKRTNIVELS